MGQQTLKNQNQLSYFRGCTKQIIKVKSKQENQVKMESTKSMQLSFRWKRWEAKNHDERKVCEENRTVKLLKIMGEMTGQDGSAPSNTDGRCDDLVAEVIEANWVNLISFA